MEFADLLAWADQGLQVSASAERVWTSLLLWAFTRLCKGPLRFLQDVILSVPWLEDQVVRALLPRYRRAVQARAPPPDAKNLASLDYFVDPAARQTLQHAALAALSVHLQAEEVLSPAQLLPQVGRVLLMAEEAQAGRYLEAVAAALASEMNAGLVRVDALLLATLAADTFGRSPEAYLAAFGGGGCGTRASAAAAPAHPSRLRLAWRALREALFELERPTVVYVRNAEALLCSSRDAQEAFCAALGADDALALAGTAARAPLVLLAGARLSDSPAARAGVRPHRQRGGAGPEGSGSEASGGEDEEGGARGPRRGGLAALEGDDDLGLADLLRGLSQLAGESRRPDTRKLLLKLFPTRVKLLPPPAGAVAARHQRRMAADAAEEAEEENYRAAAAVAASTGVRIPPKRAGIYEAGPSGRPLSRADWGKALSWAVAMQTLQERRRQAAAQAQQQAAEAGEEAAGEAAGRANGVHSPPAGRANGVHSPPPGTPADAGLRRRRLRAQQEGRASPALSRRRHAGARPRAALQPLLGALWRAANPLRWAASLAAAAAAVPRAAVALAGSAARCLAYPLYRLPWVGDWLEEAVEGSLDAAQMEAELAELEDEMAALLQAQLGGKHPAELGAGAGAELSADLAQLEGEAQAEAPAGAEAGGGALCLGQDAVRYGLRMAARSSGGVRPGVEPANAYERQLLGELLSPEDCGRGFSEVGALQEAKQALREAVQLPLQHPELFAGTALARPSKGVLLFGPPGTGKTLVARAAAAECGAAFLALNPSAMASKYFGDSVKYVRAAFTLAARLSPCVLFFDEVDALLGRRNASREHEAMREMKNELMAQWDGIQAGRQRLVVLGATNRPFDLDEAALRRFTHRVFVGLPDAAARAAILGVVLEGERLGPGVDVDALAQRTPGFSGSDLRQLCVAAAMRPVRQLLERDGAAARAAGAAAREAEQQAGGEALAGEQQAEEEAEEEAAEGAAARGEGQDVQGSGDSSQASLGDHPDGSAEAAGVHSRAASIASSASVQAGSAGGPLGSTSGGSVRSAAAALSLVPRLDSLLRQAQSIAAQPASPRADLRPISMQDFEEALREVGPSVDPDSRSVQELGEWNRQWGTGGSRSGLQDKRLSYFT